MEIFVKAQLERRYQISKVMACKIDCATDSVATKGLVTTGYYLGEACRETRYKSTQGQSLLSLKDKLDKIGIFSS